MTIPIPSVTHAPTLTLTPPANPKFCDVQTTCSWARWATCRSWARTCGRALAAAYIEARLAPVLPADDSDLTAFDRVR